MQPRALHRAACRQPTVIAPSRRPARCRSSERPQITYLCTAKQRAVMRLRVWGAGASETPHPQHARTLKQTSHLQQLPARCGRPRHLGAPQRSCPDPVRSRSASRPSVGPEPAGAAALRATPEILPKMPVSASQIQGGDSRPLRISGAINQSKSRKPSFESNVGGVGPVVADALDRPRRSILTGALASKGGRLHCIDFRYNVSIFVTRVHG